MLHASPTSAASSGLFLAAPRRTGKSTFMREDLRPALEAKGALVVYADLWENRKVNPGQIIESALRAELDKHESVSKRLAKSAGMDSVKIGGLSFTLNNVGLGKDVSLALALAALSDETQKVIVLIIGEAQHAITTSEGNDALFSLKAARDELNSSLHRGLRVVATGLNHDKLAMLRNSKDQAFFGAPLIAFPLLDQDYIAWFCAHVGLGAELDAGAVMALFKQAACRPEILGAAADTLRFDFALRPEDVPARFAEEVRQQIAAVNEDLLRVVHSLTPIQSAVLRVLASAGSGYAPFEAATLEQYKAALSKAQADNDIRVDVSAAQQALTALQEKNLVWRAARGVYALEDLALAELLAQSSMLDGLTP
ncbi:MAG: hypothetical protein ACKN9T_08545 [Candidatus Methylumidiphilus sp.]